MDNHNGCWSLAPASGAGFPFAPGCQSGNAGAGHDKRRVNKTGGEGPPVLLSIRYWIDILQLQTITFRTCFYQRGTRWGVGVFIEVSINSFASVSAFSCHCSGEARCYADRESSCLRPAVRLGSPVKHRQSEGFCVIQRTVEDGAIMARVSLMEIRLPVPFQPV